MTKENKMPNNDKCVIDLDLYVKYVKLQQYYRALFEDYRVSEYRVRAAQQIIDTLKQECIDLQLEIRKLKKAMDLPMLPKFEVEDNRKELSRKENLRQM